MSTALQIALFVASVAVVAFILFLIPVVIGLSKHAAQATRQLDELKSDLKQLVLDSRTMVQNVDRLTTRAHQQLDDVDKVVRSVRNWSERANRVVAEVGDFMEAPVLTVTRIVDIVHKGVSVLSDVAAKWNRQPEKKNPENPGKD